MVTLGRSRQETYVDKGSGNDNAGAKLLEKGKDEGQVPSHGALQEQRAKDAQRARGHDGKEKTDAETDVVVALGGIALGLRPGLLAFAADAVPWAG